MSDPIDIKSKLKIKPKINFNFKREEVFSVLEENISTSFQSWGKFQQVWCAGAFRTFKDYDKFLVWMYLISKAHQNYSDRFIYMSLNDFYENDVKLDKVNLIEISEYLSIPKETIRRKINEFQKEGILTRKGKEIILSKGTELIKKPEGEIQHLSIFIEKKIDNLLSIDWFESDFTKEQISNFITKKFSIIWLMFYRLQLPYLIRNRKCFGDLETWNIWGIIALNHQHCLAERIKNDVLITDKNLNVETYYSKILSAKPKHGINASSISDISTIPRATVIRKLKWLAANNMIKKNKDLEYLLSKSGKLNKLVNINFLINQTKSCEFVTDVLELMINSKFSMNE